MSTPCQNPDHPPEIHRLEIRRHFAAPPARLFAAWTEGGLLARWFAPTEDYVVVVARLEVKVGGAYRIEMRHEKGAVHALSGIYREVDPPHRLAFTMGWDEAPAEPPMLVALEFAAAAGGTDFTLVHTLFETRDRMLRHQAGWNGCLARLPVLL